jgi:heme/copper-type cytochrome/quinol oxidase subunit 3
MARRLTFAGGLEVYRHGLLTSVRENATAYGYSIMITSSFGVVAAFEGTSGAWWVYALYALGATIGFGLVMAPATIGVADAPPEVERTEVLLVAVLLNSASVLAGVGVAALVVRLVDGWIAWLVAPLAASVAYLVVNGLEYSIAEAEED